MITKAFILAAGRGERLKPLTNHTPKPMAVVQGKPLIAYHLEQLTEANIKDVVVNVCWLKEQIITFLKLWPTDNMSIQISDEGSQALETGGGMLKALPLLNHKPFISINADVFSDFKLSQLNQLKPNKLVHLLLVKNPDHNPNGDFSFDGENLLLKQANDTTYTYSGIGIFHPDLFISEPPNQAFSIVPLIKSAILNKQATAQFHEGIWSDVGTLERLDELNQQQ